MKKIIYASNNLGKYNELKSALIKENVMIYHYKDLEPDLDVLIEEKGHTYEENALIKAKTYAKVLNLPVVSDDGGLELIAFPELLGIHTQRMFEEGASDESKNQQILTLYNHLARSNVNRHARLIAALAYAYPSGESIVVKEEVEFKIAKYSRGNKGYGFDSILYIPTLQKTVGELLDEQRHEYSPRVLAFKQLLKRIEESNEY